MYLSQTLRGRHLKFWNGTESIAWIIFKYYVEVYIAYINISTTH